MSLILLCGRPASGKSTVAAELRSHLTNQNQDVIIVTDGDDHIQSVPNTATPEQSATKQATRAKMYQDSSTEKKTRSRLRAATERTLTKSQVTICDSLNYIKGYRYELFCVAKTSGLNYAVIYCNTPESVCLEHDKTRQISGEGAYGETLCAALMQRFEEPNSRNRWDSPLYQIDVTSSNWHETITEISAQLMNKGKKLTPTMATRLQQRPGSDVLAKLDRVTREAEATLISEIQQGAAVGASILLPHARAAVRLQRKPKVSEIRNMRRSYLGLARMHPPEEGSSETMIVDDYVAYINAQLKVSR